MASRHWLPQSLQETGQTVSHRKKQKKEAASKDAALPRGKPGKKDRQKPVKGQHHLLDYIYEVFVEKFLFTLLLKSAPS